MRARHNQGTVHTVPRVTAIPPTPPEPPDRARILLDLLALVLVLAGAITLTYGAALYAPWAGFIAGGAVTLGGGVIIGTGRDDE